MVGFGIDGGKAYLFFAGTSAGDGEEVESPIAPVVDGFAFSLFNFELSFSATLLLDDIFDKEVFISDLFNSVFLSFFNFLESFSVFVSLVLPSLSLLSSLLLFVFSFSCSISSS